MPWSVNAGFLSRIINARGQMGWDVPIVGQTTLGSGQTKALLDKPEYWAKVYQNNFRPCCYQPSGELPPRTAEFVDRLRSAKIEMGDTLLWWIAIGYDAPRLIADAVKAHGGALKLKGVHDSVLEAQAILALNDQEVTGTLRETRKDPSRYLASMVVRTAYGLQGLQGPGKGWVIASSIGDTAVTADSLTLSNLRTAFASDLVHVLRAAQDPASRVASRGRERVGAGEAEVVEVVTTDGRRLVLFLDGASHRLTAIEQSEAGSEVPVRRAWSDFRTVSGIVWPFAETRTLRGQRLMTLQVRSVQINGGVTDATFVPPTSAKAAIAPRIRR